MNNMEKINEFLKKWGMLIILPLVLISFFKSCSTSTNVNTLNKKVDKLSVTIDSNYNQINKTIKIEGLKSEDRLIKSTDRKILDINRQSEIQKEIKEIEKQ
jgi:hypothetical protein